MVVVQGKDRARAKWCRWRCFRSKKENILIVRVKRGIRNLKVKTVKVMMVTKRPYQSMI